jgi:hypothetical protein
MRYLIIPVIFLATLVTAEAKSSPQQQCAKAWPKYMKDHNLKGSQRAAFMAECVKGPPASRR